MVGIIALVFTVLSSAFCRFWWGGEDIFLRQDMRAAINGQWSLWIPASVGMTKSGGGKVGFAHLRLKPSSLILDILMARSQRPPFGRPDNESKGTILFNLSFASFVNRLFAKGRNACRIPRPAA